MTALTNNARTLASLYEPQFEQLGLEVSERAGLLAGRPRGEKCRGQAWVMPVSDTCIIVDHSVTPYVDLQFYEEPRSAYACLCTCSEAAAAIMPECGIDACPPVTPRGPWPCDPVYSFAYEKGGRSEAVLAGQRTYRSRSICLLPGYFDDLQACYPGQGFDLFASFARPWGAEASLAICTALRRLDARRMEAPGAHLFARAAIEALVAELAATRAAEHDARLARGSRATVGLAEEACALIERMLAAGRAPGVSELAGLLYVSRSHLCAVFSQEVGQSVGAYVRKRRMERACAFLEAGAGVAAVAEAVGYATPDAFGAAFAREMGCTPGVWRETQGCG